VLLTLLEPSTLRAFLNETYLVATFELTAV
jgi:hypothetical protein